jgi:hypothetical protein
LIDQYLDRRSVDRVIALGVIMIRVLTLEVDTPMEPGDAKNGASDHNRHHRQWLHDAPEALLQRTLASKVRG